MKQIQTKIPSAFFPREEDARSSSSSVFLPHLNHSAPSWAEAKHSLILEQCVVASAHFSSSRRRPARRPSSALRPRAPTDRVFMRPQWTAGAAGAAAQPTRPNLAGGQRVLRKWSSGLIGCHLQEPNLGLSIQRKSLTRIFQIRTGKALSNRE